jgi:DNA-binding NarL/FixJ family response regulator
MTLRPGRRAMPIRLALRVADADLRARLVRACKRGDIVLAGPGEASDDADIILADRPPDTAAPVIALTEARHADWRCDLRAVVPPDLDDATLGAVISAVAAGFTVMPRESIGRAGAWADATRGCAEHDKVPADLTPREREVLALLAEGASNKAIARALSVSVHTAKFHVSSLTEKLGAGGRQEAVAIAIRSGLLML